MITCPVCGSRSFQSLLYVGKRPLSVCELQPTATQSISLPTYDIHIFICCRCTHVFNGLFDPNVDQYSEDGCTMYNNGEKWQKHLQAVAENLNMIPRGRVVEIGAGDGSFLELLHGEKLAYEPSRDYLKIEKRGIPVKRAYFDPFRDGVEGNDLIVMRHVLEHLHQPHKFLDELVTVAILARKQFHIYIEVPCVENALRDMRLEDWTYEHPNHFTEASLRSLLMLAGFTTDRICRAYGGEVLCAVAHVTPINGAADFALHQFKSLQALKLNMPPVIFWGGAGKGTMMLHALSRPGDRVVDSDWHKWGKFVPGLALKIDTPEIITPKDSVLITTNWREADIIADMKRRYLEPAVVYTIKAGKLHVSKF